MKRILTIAAAVVLIAALLLTGCVAQPVSAQATPAAADVVSPGVTKIEVTAKNAVDTRNTISVSALGEKKLMPDVAYVTVGVLSMNAKLKSAQDDNRTKMDAIYKALNDKGITKDDIRTSSYNVNPQYDYSSSKPRITGYEVNNMIEITVNKIDTVGDVLDACQTAGANTAYPIRFDLKDKTAAYNDALKAAVEKAKGKADLIAGTTNSTISGVIRVDEGSTGYTPMYDESRMYAAAESKAPAPATQIDAGELTVTASVTVVYEIK